MNFRPDNYLSIMSSDYYYINQKKNILKLCSLFFRTKLSSKTVTSFRNSNFILCEFLFPSIDDEGLFVFVVLTLNSYLFHFLGKRSLDRISVDRNCVLSVDQNCGNHLIEFFDTFHLIESLNNEFDQTPKNSSVDRIIRSTAKIHQFFFGS